jgi:hypothetical protein
VPWEKEPPYRTPLFNVYPEPGIAKRDIIGNIGEAERIVTELKKNFFPLSTNRRINVILYRDQKSYSMYRRVLFDSLADFERNEFRINVPLNAPRTTWRHELAHALLESARPLSPFWLHEGLALFLQEGDFTESIGCANHMAVSMPSTLRSYLPDLRRRDDLFSVKLGKNSDDTLEFNTGLAGYFIFFLWHRKKLLPLLIEYQRGDRPPEWYIVHGDRAKWRSLIEDFRLWIKSEYPEEALPGC